VSDGFLNLRLCADERAMKTYFVYVLRCADGSFYVRITNDLEFRVGQHQFGIDPDCYTVTRRPVELVHSADFCNVDDAIAWEKQLKGWSRAKKIALIENDWVQIHRLAKCKEKAGRGRSGPSPFDSAPLRLATLAQCRCAQDDKLLRGSAQGDTG
jgi:putative endonuclease